jgi:hypothetical protein
MFRTTPWALAATLCLFSCTTADAVTTIFFDSSQVATDVASGGTSDTISSNGYLFTYTRDKLFTGGTGVPIGRSVRVPWPEGVEAQAVTTPPPGVTDYKARITLQRVDSGVFDLTAFTAKLLANTAGTGGSIEIMPILNGEDAFNDPLYFDVSGYAGNTFSYDTSPNYLGSTALLTGFETYKITLFVDFALTALTLEDASILGDANADGMVDDRDASILGTHWLQIGGAKWLDGDFNGDGNVNDADAAILAAHWGEGGGEESVPEPGSLALLAGMVAMGAVCLRRRKA